jgi:hypothetical protein
MSARPEIPMEPKPSGARWKTLRRRLILGTVGLILAIVAGMAAWAWITLNVSYSTGERVGYIQKISKKGWVCKTWEGELAMLNQPGVPPQIFAFSVRDDAVAQNIMKAAGQRVNLKYEQHRGVPTSCFGETEYFVTGVSPLGP